VTYLALVKDGSEAVEELKRRDDVALNQNSSKDSRCGPPSCAYGHLEEPLFEWELSEGCITSSAAAEYGIHVDRVRGRFKAPGCGAS